MKTHTYKITAKFKRGSASTTVKAYTKTEAIAKAKELLDYPPNATFIITEII